MCCQPLAHAFYCPQVQPGQAEGSIKSAKRLAWPLRKDDTHKSRSVTSFLFVLRFLHSRSSDKIGTIQRRLTWPLRKDNAQNCKIDDMSNDTYYADGLISNIAVTTHQELTAQWVVKKGFVTKINEKLNTLHT